MKIETKADFESWLNTNFWLEDAIINALEPHPKPTTKNTQDLDQVTLTLTLQVGGSLQAGEKRWMRDIKIIAKDVKNYSINFEEGFIKGHSCQGIELIEVEQGLGFTLDVPETLQIICTCFEIEQSSDREEIVEPWFNPNDFFAYAILNKAPSPKDWIEYLQKKDLDVVWRYHYSEKQAVERVPQDYTGWFLQLRSRLNANPQGLFFQHCQLDEKALSLHLCNFDQVSHQLWVEAGRYVATFPNLSIFCGNTKMNKTEWLSYLTQFDK